MELTGKDAHSPSKPVSDAESTSAIAVSASVHVFLNDEPTTPNEPSMHSIKGLAADLTFEERLAAPAADHIPRRGGKLINATDWTPLPAEDGKTYLRRLFTEGHTVIDAFMTCADAQVGQIMLNSPMALYLMGLYSGSIAMFFFLVFGYWTIYQFMALYLELKRNKIKDGSWYETDGRHERVIQIFDVFGHFLGTWASIVSATLAFIALVGVLMIQIIACANNMYFVDPSRTKQQWALIYGGTMVFVMSFFPRFSHFRILNVIGLVTVGAMAIYIIITASSFGVHYEYIKPWARTSQDWFNGASIWLTILGTHTVTFETLEHMEQPKHFKVAFSSAWIWTILVTVPHSILCNLVYGQMFGQLGGAVGANIFIVLERTSIIQIIQNKPASTSKYAMAILMNIHQFIAFALYGTSLAYIWEKALRIHTKPWYVRVPARLPLAGLVWFLAILCPFYGPLNSLKSSIAIPFLGFVMPSLCLLVFFKSREDLDNSMLKPYRFIRKDYFGIAPRLEKIHPRLGLISTLWWWMNFFCIIIFTGFGGAAIYYSCLSISQSYQTFGVFNPCYGCSGK